MDQPISNLISIQANLVAFAAQSNNPIAKKNFQLSAQLAQEVIDTLRLRMQEKEGMRGFEDDNK